MSSTGVSRIAGIDPFTSFKAPCTVATTANITLSGAQTVDGVAVAETTPKTRVLVKDQTDQTENGIYDVYDTAWVRSDDFNGTRDATKGTMINIQSGTSWTGVTFRLTTTGTVVFGTSSITFESANPANSTTVIGAATLDTYAELMAINTGQYSNGDIIYLAGSGIAGNFRLVNSVAHSITSTTGVQIRINDDWYAQRVGESFNVKLFGAKGDGTTLDDTAFQAANDYAKSLDEPCEIIVSSGEYLINSIIVDYDYACFTFVGKVILKANSNDSILFHQINSFASHSGTFKTDSNGKTDVWGMACAPLDLTQTTTLVQTNHNQMPGIIGDSQLELCIGLQCGPDVDGTDSGCFYNVFPFGRGRGAVGGIRLFPGPNASSSSCNRNTFRDFRMGTGGGVSANFGVYIESGDTNKFFGCDFEGVGSGTARTSPLATPTAVKILDQDANGIDNNFNTFFGGQYEANTRDLDIDNARTYLYGVGYDDSKSITPSSTVFQTLPARDSSGARSRLMGLEYTNVTGDSQLDSVKVVGGRISFPATQNPSSDPNTLDDYEEGTFTPTISFGGGSTGITYSSQNGFYTKIGREVNFRIFITLSSKGTDTGAAQIDNLPFTSNSSSGNINPVQLRMNTVSFADYPQGYVSTNTSSIILEEITNAGTKTNLVDGNFSNTSSLTVAGTYMV